MERSGLPDHERQLLEELVRSMLPDAELVRATLLDPDAATISSTHKGTGYGAPVRIELLDRGRTRSLVLHTATKNEFGHDRRADRAAAMLLAADSFGLVPGHVRVLDVGAYGVYGGCISLRNSGEFYVLTEWGDGTPYADDLRAIAERGRADARDLQRTDVLVDRLLALHGERLPDTQAYTRAIRDLLGSGEGIFGIVDAYPGDTPAASPERLLGIQQQCLVWRERLKQKHQRLRRIHGDYHPFNLLFDDHDQLVLLDASRGCAGDPADDLTALSVNYLFFGLEAPGAWPAGFAPLWHRFWGNYLERASDPELPRVMAPFFAWRCLVVCCPRWYPDLRESTRDKLLWFAEQLLGGTDFSPDLAQELFDR
jgi:hypothetical protein